MAGPAPGPMRFAATRPNRPANRIRAHLCDRGITAVIPEPDDQKRHRPRRGQAGGRPRRFDAFDYKGLNVIERGSAIPSNGAD